MMRFRLVQSTEEHPEMQTEPSLCDTFFALAFESLRFQMSTQGNEAF